MYFNKLPFTILAIFAVYIDADRGVDLTLDKYIGKWNIIAVIYPWAHYINTTCEKYIITKQPGSDEKFNEIATSVFEGKLHTMKLEGEIYNSIVTQRFSLLKTRESSYAAKVFDNGKEVILVGVSQKFFSFVASRTSTASKNILDKLQKIAIDVGGVVSYMNHTICLQ